MEQQEQAKRKPAVFLGWLTGFLIAGLLGAVTVLVLAGRILMPWASLTRPAGAEA